MRVVGRDLIRGGHYGQRSCEPHSKAEHMAAPTNAAKHEKSSCQPGAVHTWHFSDVAGLTDDVGSLGVKRTHGRHRENDAKRDIQSANGRALSKSIRSAPLSAATPRLRPLLRLRSAQSRGPPELLFP